MQKKKIHDMLAKDTPVDTNPDIEYKVKEEDEEDEEEVKLQVCEYVFLLDRSGSMTGGRIRLAVEALKLFIHSLPEGCYFNVVSYGSSFKLLYPRSVLYN